MGFKISAFAVLALMLFSARAGHAQNLINAPNPGHAIKQGDLAEAARQARRLAEAGDPDGQFMLALFFWHGIAVTQSFQDALNWITLASVSGHQRAPNARLAMLKTMEPKLQQKSMEWTRARLTQQAEAGDNQALLRLAVSYSKKFGFENALEAYFWYNLSVSSGNVGARKQRNLLVAELKPADVLKAQERAKDWFGQWRNTESQAADLTEQLIDTDKEPLKHSLDAMESEVDHERGRNAPDQMQGGLVEQR